LKFVSSNLVVVNTIPLKIEDITDWLYDNEDEFKELSSREFPDLKNHLTILYPILQELINYYSLSVICENAISEMRNYIINSSDNQIIDWVSRYNELGSKKLISFRVLYLDWNEPIEKSYLKIRDDLFIERAPFESIIMFYDLFQILYWNNSINDTVISKDEFKLIKIELSTIIQMDT